jgi:hypothetical protein
MLLPSCGQPDSSKSTAHISFAGLEVSVFSSFAVAATIGFVAGAVILVALLERAGTNDSIARLLYDTEHQEKTR